MKMYIEGDGEIPNYYRFGALKNHPSDHQKYERFWKFTMGP